MSEPLRSGRRETSFTHRLLGGSNGVPVADMDLFIQTIPLLGRRSCYGPRKESGHIKLTYTLGSEHLQHPLSSSSLLLAPMHVYAKKGFGIATKKQLGPPADQKAK